MIYRIKNFLKRNLLLFFSPKKKIFVLSLHKSGTHLLQKALQEMGLKPVFSPREATIDSFRFLKKNQYLISHHAPGVQMLESIYCGDVKMIFNYRDPRDVLLSKMEWWTTNKKVTNLPREFIKEALNKQPRDFIFQYLLNSERILSGEQTLNEMYLNNRIFLWNDRVLKVKFEDLVGERGGGSEDAKERTIQNLIDYLGMAKNLADNMADSIFDKEADTFNKGKIGRYQICFTPEEIQMFNKKYDAVLRQYGYRVS